MDGLVPGDEVLLGYCLLSRGERAVRDHAVYSAMVAHLDLERKRGCCKEWTGDMNERRVVRRQRLAKFWM